MAVAYDVVSIVDEQDLLELKEVYSRSESIQYFQNYNLFNIEYRQPPKAAVTNKINKYIGRKPINHYFLKYSKDSFARLHNDHRSSTTVVTVIETEDLVGGETICFLPYEKKGRPKELAVKRAGREQNDPPYNQPIIPETIYAKTGQSVIYSKDLRHGVSRVHSGHRIVLISWFTSDIYTD